jgi:hypothetical protein
MWGSAALFSALLVGAALRGRTAQESASRPRTARNDPSSRSVLTTGVGATGEIKYRRPT